jgi:hypothetical protein
VFLRGEAARLGFSVSAFLFSGDAVALSRFAHSLIPCVNDFQIFSISAFQLFSSAGPSLSYSLTR